MLPLWYDCLVVRCLNWFFLVWLWRHAYNTCTMYMCAKCVVSHVKCHYSSTERLIFAQYICMRRVGCCVLQIITAGSICTLITLHFAVSFSITNNSFDVRSTLPLLLPHSPIFNTIYLREGAHLFQRALNLSCCWVSAIVFRLFYYTVCWMLSSCAAVA